jgi:hypothetical protein
MPLPREFSQQPDSRFSDPTQSESLIRECLDSAQISVSEQEIQRLAQDFQERTPARFSRRTFLKGAGISLAAILTLVLGRYGLSLVDIQRFLQEREKSPPEPTKTEFTLASELDQFYQDIESFDLANLARIQTELEAIGKQLGKCFVEAGFTPEKWQASVDSAMVHLRKIVEGYHEAVAEFAGDEHATTWLKQYGQKHYYELASAIWAVLKVGQQYQHDPQLLAQKVQQYVANGFQILDDSVSLESSAFILEKEHTLGITALWSSLQNEHTRNLRDAYIDPVIDLFGGLREGDRPQDTLYPEEKINIYNEPGLTKRYNATGLGRIPMYYLSLLGNPSGSTRIENYQTELDEKTGQLRPQETTIISHDPRAAKLVQQTLEEYGLDRVLPSVETIPHHTQYGSYDTFERSVWLFYNQVMGKAASRDEFLDVNQYFRSPNIDPLTLQYLVTHEATHGVYFNVSHLSGSNVYKAAWLIEQILKPVRPYANLEFLLEALYSQRPPWARILTWQSMAIYSFETLELNAWPSEGVAHLLGSEFRECILSFMRDLNALTSETQRDTAPQSGTYSERNAFSSDKTFLSFVSSPEVMGQTLDKRSLTDWWNMTYAASNQLALTTFERLILDEMNEVMQTIELPQAMEDSSASSFTRIAERVILPTILTKLVMEKPEVLQAAYEVSLPPDPNLAEIWKHNFQVFMKQLEHILNNTADVELFPEIVANSLRSDKLEVKWDTLPEGFDIDLVKQQFQQLIDLLIDNALATNTEQGRGNMV